MTNDQDVEGVGLAPFQGQIPVSVYRWKHTSEMTNWYAFGIRS